MALVRLDGVLDAATAPELVARLQPLSRAAKRIVIDLRRAESIDRDGVHALLALQGMLEAHGAELRLAARPGSGIRNTLGQFANLDRLDLYDGLLDAWILRGGDGAGTRPATVGPIPADLLSPGSGGD